MKFPTTPLWRRLGEPAAGKPVPANPRNATAALLLLSLLLLGAVGAQAQSPAPVPSATPPSAAVAAATPAALTSCLSGLQPAAAEARVSGDTWRRLTADLRPETRALELLDNQPEFRLAIWDYLAVLVDDQRIADGRSRLAEHADTLRRVAERYGVDAETVVAVWGVESDFGQGFGRFELIPSLATLSCFGRRQAFFRGELFALLRIVQSGDLSAERLVGSWAGAFGHTQFMPSTYERLAVDFDADGRRDLIASIPDALGSTANFLDKAGWRRGEPWGFEVRWPPGNDPFPMAGEGRRAKKPLSHWAERGFRRADGSPLQGTDGTLTAQSAAGLIAPSGPRGPAFLVLRNFDALFSYNAAESYGLAIAHLADRLRGRGPFVTPWPTDDPGLSRRDAREVQTLLNARGHDLGEPDGRLGPRSRAAIKLEQERRGLEPTGRAGQKLLQALRSGQ